MFLRQLWFAILARKSSSSSILAFSVFPELKNNYSINFYWFFDDETKHPWLAECLSPTEKIRVSRYRGVVCVMPQSVHSGDCVWHVVYWLRRVTSPPHHPVEDQASPLTHPPPSTPIFIGFHLFTRWLFIPILINWLSYLLFCYCLGVGSYIAPYNTPLELNIMEWKEIITEIFINIKLLISCWLSSHCQWLRTHLINK